MRKYDNLANTISKTAKDVSEYKAAQYSGSDTATFKLTASANDYDFERTASGWATGQDIESHNIFMKFTSDNQKAAFAIIVIDCLIDNTYHFIANLGQTSDSGAYEGVFFNGTIEDVYGNYAPDTTTYTEYDQGWYDAFDLTSLGKNVKLKFKVYSTDSGTAKIKIDGKGGTTITI